MSNKRLYVESFGTGRDLTLIHGWGSHGGIWGDTARQLAPRFRVHVVDLPGYGRSAPISISNLGDLVDAVSQSAPALTHVCGWSLGAAVALAWARTQPEQIDRLSLVAATPCFVTRPDWRRGLAPEVLRSFAAELRRDARAGLTRFASLQAADSRATLVQLRAHLFARGEPSLPVLDSGLQLLAQTDLRQDVAEVLHPTLLLHGASDRLVPLAAARWLFEHLPEAKLQLFHGCGHVPFLSKPSRFAQAIQDFFHA